MLKNFIYLACLSRQQANNRVLGCGYIGVVWGFVGVVVHYYSILRVFIMGGAGDRREPVGGWSWAIRPGGARLALARSWWGGASLLAGGAERSYSWGGWLAKRCQPGGRAAAGLLAR